MSWPNIPKAECLFLIGFKLKQPLKIAFWDCVMWLPIKSDFVALKHWLEPTNCLRPYYMWLTHCPRQHGVTQHHRWGGVWRGWRAPSPHSALPRTSSWWGWRLTSSGAATVTTHVNIYFELPKHEKPDTFLKVKDQSSDKIILIYIWKW